MDRRLDLKSLPLDRLTAEVTGPLGERPFRARQIYKWLHQRGANAFEEMTDLSQGLRTRLAEAYQLSTLELAEARESRDGTVKFRFRTVDDRSIESVYIPEWPDRTGDAEAPDAPPARQTLCVSSQVGCAMACAFCMTGTMGFLRNLRAGEIVAQVHQVNAWLMARGAPGPRPLTNLVFMGMGEPLHNYFEVKRALDILVSVEGPNFSTRRVTVSTSGLVPMMKRLGEETDVKLAVSLTGTTDQARDRLMPVNRKWPIAEVLDACRAFPLRYGRRITFEYVLLRGETDTLEDAERLADLLRGIPAKVNLIAYNEGRDLDDPDAPPPLGFYRPDDATVAAFRQRMADKGLTAVIRRSRGRDVAAACGQLAVEGGRRRPSVYDGPDGNRSSA